MSLARLLHRCDAIRLRVEWDYRGRRVKCLIQGRTDVAGYGDTGRDALHDLMTRLGGR